VIIALFLSAARLRSLTNGPIYTELFVLSRLTDNSVDRLFSVLFPRFIVCFVPFNRFIVYFCIVFPFNSFLA